MARIIAREDQALSIGGGSCSSYVANRGVTKARAVSYGATVVGTYSDNQLVAKDDIKKYINTYCKCDYYCTCDYQCVGQACNCDAHCTCNTKCSCNGVCTCHTGNCSCNGQCTSQVTNTCGCNAQYTCYPQCGCDYDKLGGCNCNCNYNCNWYSCFFEFYNPVCPSFSCSVGCAHCNSDNTYYCRPDASASKCMPFRQMQNCRIDDVAQECSWYATLPPQCYTVCTAVNGESPSMNAGNTCYRVSTSSCPSHKGSACVIYDLYGAMHCPQHCTCDNQCTCNGTNVVCRTQCTSKTTCNCNGVCTCQTGNCSCNGQCTSQVNTYCTCDLNCTCNSAYCNCDTQCDCDAHCTCNSHCSIN